MNTFNIPAPTSKEMAAEMIHVGKLYLNIHYGLAATASPPQTVYMPTQMAKVVTAACKGLGNKGLAQTFGLSVSTIRTYISAALKLTTSTNRTEMVYKLLNKEIVLEGRSLPVGRPPADLSVPQGDTPLVDLDTEQLQILKLDLQQAINAIEGQS